MKIRLYCRGEKYTYKHLLIDVPELKINLNEKYFDIRPLPHMFKNMSKESLILWIIKNQVKVTPTDLLKPLIKQEKEYLKIINILSKENKILDNKLRMFWDSISEVYGITKSTVINNSKDIERLKHFIKYGVSKTDYSKDGIKYPSEIRKKIRKLLTQQKK